jgi:hypothetical protein
VTCRAPALDTRDTPTRARRRAREGDRGKGAEGLGSSGGARRNLRGHARSQGTCSWGIHAGAQGAECARTVGRAGLNKHAAAIRVSNEGSAGISAGAGAKRWASAARTSQGVSQPPACQGLGARSVRGGAGRSGIGAERGLVWRERGASLSKQCSRPMALKVMRALPQCMNTNTQAPTRNPGTKRPIPTGDSPDQTYSAPQGHSMVSPRAGGDCRGKQEAGGGA